MNPNLKEILDQDQIVSLTIDQNGVVTDMQNLWQSKHEVTAVFDPKHPCSFTTPVDKGRTIKWIGFPNSDNDKIVEISIDYVLMINGRGKQILKSKTYNRGSGKTVLGRVKTKGVNNGEIEDYFIIYSVDGKAFILDPKLKYHENQ